ncbi:MAG: methyltransferase family protein [Solirubrobacteraceae bacterium]
MQTIKIIVTIAWVAFGVGWFAVALTAKRSTNRTRRISFQGLTAVAVVLLIRVFRGGGLAVHSPVLAGVGVAIFACGLGLAIWARVNLGRNWGMPMTQKLEPELVTSGPYRFVRHPVYSGLLAAVLGTALVTNLIGIAIAAVLCAYFAYCARVEERNLTATFPREYPAYRSATKMLIPFVL